MRERLGLGLWREGLPLGFPHGLGLALLGLLPETQGHGAMQLADRKVAGGQGFVRLAPDAAGP